MKKIFLILILSAVLCVPVLALAQNYGLDATAGAAKLKTEADLPATAGKVIGTLLSLIGVIFFGLMIYGGFMWMTARGNEEQAKKALDTIIAAVIGLVIILAAYAITNFIFKSVSSTQQNTSQKLPFEAGQTYCFTNCEDDSCYSKVAPADFAGQDAILDEATSKSCLNQLNGECPSPCPT